MQRSSSPGLLALLASSASLLAAALPASSATLVAFVTSISGSPDLQNWPESGGLSGLPGADAICRQRAVAGGLADPASFIALLSNAADDAYCRVHGLSGKKLTNCGVAGDLPPTGPWQRTDGAPFVPNITSALAPIHRVYRPLHLDEFGFPVSGADAAYFTGTNSSGIASGNDCDDWSSTDSPGAFLTLGLPSATGSQWVAGAFSNNCGTVGRLLCLQAGAGDALEPWQQPARLAFLSAGSVQARFELEPQSQGAVGITGADNICRAKASAAGLANADAFRAWLSDSFVDAHDRFVDGPWKRLDGVRIADDLADLVDGELQTAISQDEFGGYTGGASVWTGTLSDGMASSDHCADWTADDFVTFGLTAAATRTTDWAGATLLPCGQDSVRLFCFEDGELAEIFRDGFETGTTAAWAATSP